MNFRMWSRNWFNNYYHEDIYGYIEKRFIPIVRKYMGGIKGIVLDAGCGFGNPYLEELHPNNIVGMDIDPTVTETNYIKNLSLETYITLTQSGSLKVLFLLTLGNIYTLLSWS